MRVRLHGPRGADDRDFGASPVLVMAAGANASAAIALENGAPFLQPLEGGAPVFLNDHRLAASQWLRDGDTVRIGADALAVGITRNGLGCRLQLM